MRLQGHKLNTTWNHVRGDGSVTNGACVCKKWKYAGSSQAEVRNEYRLHVAAAKRTTKKKPATAKKPAAKKVAKTSK